MCSTNLASQVFFTAVTFLGTGLKVSAPLDKAAGAFGPVNGGLDGKSSPVKEPISTIVPGSYPASEYKLALFKASVIYPLPCFAIAGAFSAP